MNSGYIVLIVAIVAAVALIAGTSAVLVDRHRPARAGDVHGVRITLVFPVWFRLLLVGYSALLAVTGTAVIVLIAQQEEQVHQIKEDLQAQARERSARFCLLVEQAAAAAAANGEEISPLLRASADAVDCPRPVLQSNLNEQGVTP